MLKETFKSFQTSYKLRQSWKKCDIVLLSQILYSLSNPVQTPYITCCTSLRSTPLKLELPLLFLPPFSKPSLTHYKEGHQSKFDLPNQRPHSNSNYLSPPPLVSCQMLPACSPKLPFNYAYGPGHSYAYFLGQLLHSSLLKFSGYRLKVE